MHYEINPTKQATIPYEEVMEKVPAMIPSDLVDLGMIDIDETKPLAERFASFMEQIKNPYVFAINGLTVSLAFDGQKTLCDALKTALAG